MLYHNCIIKNCIQALTLKVGLSEYFYLFFLQFCHVVLFPFQIRLSFLGICANKRVFMKDNFLDGVGRLHFFPKYVSTLDF